MKWIQLSVVLVAFAAFLLPPSASAIVLCEDCPLNPSPYARCIGICDNGDLVRYCTDWIYLGCTGLYFAPSTHVLDTLFPQPAFLLPATEASYQGACPSAK